MILQRVFPLDPRAREEEPGGALWFPRQLQGYGRHDNPGLYGCIYVSETPASTIAEALAGFRGAGGLLPDMLERGGRPLALATLEAPEDLPMTDLDDPATLTREGLRPSRVATRDRAVTQPQAARLYEAGAAGLRWWSTLESLWLNVTLFDRAGPLSVEAVEPLTVEAEPVREAAGLLGLAV